MPLLSNSSAAVWMAMNPAAEILSVVLTSDARVVWGIVAAATRAAAIAKIERADDLLTIDELP
jgi:hypothetical protein